MACNNTTYLMQVLNSTELRDEYFKNSFTVNIFNFNAPVAMLINKIITPVWVIVGVFGNSLSALVWANPHMRTCNTAAYYLTCLAIADLTFLIVHSIMELQYPWLLGVLDIQGWCQIISMANMSIQYFCVFMVFAFTVERFISICHPFRSERFGETRTPRIIAGLLVFAIVLGLPQTYFWTINRVGECRNRHEEMPDGSLFFDLFTWISELGVFGVLPLIVLILNSCVLLKIRHVGKLRLGSIKIKSGKGNGSPRPADEANRLVPSMDTKKTADRGGRAGLTASRQTASASKVQSSSHSGTTITLLWVSFYLIGTMLPNTLLYVLQIIVRAGPMPCQIEDMGNHPTWQTYFTFASVKMIVKEISLSHHVGNIFIYMATSRRFVNLVMTNLTHRSKPKKDSNDTSMHTIRTNATYNEHRNHAV